MGETYNDRWEAAVREGRSFAVYVPAGEGFALPTGWARVAQGSAIIGREDETPGLPGRLECCYEGNLYGNVPDFAQKADAAGSRLVTRYPTVARAWFPREELRKIGEWTPGRGVRIDDVDALVAWETI